MPIEPKTLKSIHRAGQTKANSKCTPPKTKKYPAQARLNRFQPRSDRLNTLCSMRCGIGLAGSPPKRRTLLKIMAVPKIQLISGDFQRSQTSSCNSKVRPPKAKVSKNVIHWAFSSRHFCMTKNAPYTTTDEINRAWVATKMP